MKYKSERGETVDAEQLEADGKVGELEAAAGTWVITHDDGTVKLMHPTAFEQQFTKGR